MKKYRTSRAAFSRATKRNKAPAVVKGDTAFATWKFEFENTVNADPRLGMACLKVVRAYLDWVTSPKSAPYLSIIHLRTATALTEHTIIKARRELEAHGYFVPQGKSSSGAVKYNLVNAGMMRVLDHMTISRETLKELDASKKERDRKKKKSGTAKNAGDLGSANNAGQDVDRACIDYRDSPANFAGNYVYNTVEDYSYEEGRYLVEGTESAFIPPPDPDDARLWLYRLCSDKTQLADALVLLAQGRLTPEIVKELAA